MATPVKISHMKKMHAPGLGGKALRATSSLRFSHTQFNACWPSTGVNLASSLPTSSRLYSRPINAPAGKRNHSTASTSRKEPIIHHIFEKVTGTWQYVVADPWTLGAVIIDPVLNFNPITQAISTDTADTLLCLVKERGYTIEKILETHAHADHLTAASYIQQLLLKTTGLRPPIGIGKRIIQVQELFGKKYEIPQDEYRIVFDHLFDDNETFDIGQMNATAIHLPGHTPDHMGYKIGGKVLISSYMVFHVH